MNDKKEKIIDEVRRQYSETGTLECPKKYKKDALLKGYWEDGELILTNEENKYLSEFVGKALEI